ncbi:MAG: hypothetical protein GY828_05980 [Candidatus Gracilibacteria bacterium]|nr:hypothetical protein [Candidatus Gracilibacteria bacterium]
MKISENLLSKQKQEAIIKSLLWNSIVEVFNNEKKIDITEGLVSIKKSGSTLRVTSNNPLLSQEFIYLDDKIQKLFKNKVIKIGIILGDCEIKYK